MQYITERLDLNETVHLSGEALKKLVIRTLPKGIIRMVYSKASTRKTRAPPPADP